MSHHEQYAQLVRPVEDFPSPGIRFYDISPLIGNGAVFASLISDMAEPLRDKVTTIVGFDARGFLFAGAMARELGVGCAMLRKPGKLPGDTYQVSYDLEYGSNALEIQADAVQPGEKVALVDDVIATGGTALAGIELVKKCGGSIVEFCALVDLPQLGGSQRIIEGGVPVRSILLFGEK